MPTSYFPFPPRVSEWSLLHDSVGVGAPVVLRYEEPVGASASPARGRAIRLLSCAS